MKKMTLFILFLTFFFIMLFSGCLGTGSGLGGDICIIGIVGLVLFIILIAAIASGRKTVVETHYPPPQQMPPPPQQMPPQPVIVREKSNEDSKPDRRCPECGRVIPMDSIICPFCGKKFKNYFDEEEKIEKHEDKKEKKTFEKQYVENEKFKFCIKCGYKLDEEDLKFCPKCGAKLK